MPPFNHYLRLTVISIKVNRIYVHLLRFLIISLYLHTMKLFKNLTTQEETEFRQWARDNYVCFSDISGIWHPVVQDECKNMNDEAYLEDILRV